jgi:endo-1,4-beta-mannosidase
MSGPNWIPAWAMSADANDRPAVYVVDGRIDARKPRDIFTDAGVIEAELRLVRAVVGRLRAHPAVWGWDVCNEIDLVQLPRGDDGMRWLERITSAIRALDPVHPVTAGILQTPDDAPRGFHRADHRFTDVASVHAYPLYDAASRGFDDVAYVGRMIEETRRASGVPVMLTEFGLPTSPDGGTRAVTMTFGPRERTVTLVDEAEAAGFVRAVLPVACDAGAVGALIWCYSDYDPALYGETPFDALIHERYFGIFDARGRLKATGAALRDFAASR